MAKDLIIVESPTKTRTLKKFLGSSYLIEASVGHIRDLEKKDLGIGEDYEPRYRVLPEKQDVVKKLKQAAKKAGTVYLAPDPDREGEAIAWHISQIIGKDDDTVRRVTFNEITESAVKRALDDPGTIDFRKVEAQQARRVLDRLMGFKLSPLLWEKVKRGLSAGRVQSVALKMICAREAEIEAFQPVEYWLIGSDLEVKGEQPGFHARLHQIDGKKAEVGNGEQAAEIVQALEAGTYTVAKIEKKESRQRPSPPFITSRLQQEASRRFGFSVKRTMTVAQRLYEGQEIGDRGQVGLITYMRTDSTRVADEAISAVRSLIAQSYGEKMLPPKPNVYRSKKGAQDAHEAIRPTTFDITPEVADRFLPPEQAKLYRLIWDRFVASQMVPARFDVTQADIEVDRYMLRAQGRVMKDPGFLAVYEEVKKAKTDEQGESGSSKDTLLPPLAEGDDLALQAVKSEQKFTKPPARFSEATLVRTLEDNGIGRPSTYASILSTLSHRDYVEKVKRRFHPTALGKLVNQLLQAGFPDIINEGYTARLETQLDRIEEGDLEWKGALADFDRKFSKDLETAASQMPDVKREGVPLDESCPDCESPLVMRFGRYGGFIGCSTYPDCKYTRNVEDPSDSEEQDGSGEEKEIPPCDKCGKEMVKRRSRYGTFYGCSGYPECKNILRTGPAAEPPKGTGIKCPDCGEGEMMEKKSRRGKIFYSCGRYPDCKFALWNPPVEEPCPQCEFPLLTRKVTKRKGPHLVCHKKECDYERILPEEAETSDGEGASDGASA